MNSYIFKSFDDFVNWSIECANEIHTMIDVCDYWEHGFGQIKFMVDKFGGTYCCFHYNFKDGTIINWLGTSKVHQIDNIEELKNVIIKGKEEMLKSRDLNEISNLINSEY